MSADQTRRVLVAVELPLAAKDDPDAITVDGNTVAVSAAVRESIAAGARLAGGGRLLLFHSTPPIIDGAVYGGFGAAFAPTGDWQGYDRKVRAAAETVLHAIAGEVCPDANVEVSVRPGAPRRTILEEAAEFAPDYVVIATSGRGGVSRFFLGSTADRVIRLAPCPVLVIPAHDRAEAAAELTPSASSASPSNA